MEKYKIITIKTMQGIGDIVWCLQRLHPYFEKVNLRIMQIEGQNHDTNTIQERSRKFFMPIYPGFVNSVEMDPCSGPEYNRVAATEYYMKNILDSYKADPVNSEKISFEFATNKQLELGKRLYELEPGIEVTETIPITTRPALIPFEEYMILYVSGSKSHEKTWSVAEWVEYINGIYSKFNLTLPIMLTGASFDEKTLDTVGFMLKQYGHKVAYFIGGDSDQVMDFFKRAKFFVGYQSGLNILADQLDVPQVMLYFEFLQGLRRAWPKKKNLDNGTHQIFGFNQTPAQAVEATQKAW